VAHGIVLAAFPRIWGCIWLPPTPHIALYPFHTCLLGKKWPLSWRKEWLASFKASLHVPHFLSTLQGTQVLTVLGVLHGIWGILGKYSRSHMLPVSSVYSEN
jgi:hypothetical protein